MVVVVWQWRGSGVVVAWWWRGCGVAMVWLCGGMTEGDFTTSLAACAALGLWPRLRLARDAVRRFSSHAPGSLSWELNLSLGVAIVY